MTISIFGIVLTIFLLKNFIYRRRMLGSYMEIFTFVIIASALFLHAGYYLQIGVFKIDYFKFLYVFNIAAIFVILIFDSSKIKINTKQLFIVICLNLSIILGYIMFYFYEFDILILDYNTGFDETFTLGKSALSKINIGMTNYISFVTLLLFQVFVIVNSKWVNKDTFLKLKKTFHIIFIIIIIEFLVTNIFSVNVREIWNLILGIRDSQVTHIIKRFGFNVSYGPFSEPGYISSMLLIYYNLYCLDKLTYRTDHIYFGLSILVGIISGSTAAFLVIFSVVLYKYFRPLLNKYLNLKSIAKNHIYFLGGILLIFTFLIYSDKLNGNVMVIINKVQGFIIGAGGNSEVTRSNSMKYVMQSFIQSPLFGVGYGSTTAPGLIPTILANFGIINLVFYTVFIISAIKKCFKIKIDIIKIVMNAILWFFMGQLSYTYSPIMFIILFSVIHDEKLNK